MFLAMTVLKILLKTDQDVHLGCEKACQDTKEIKVRVRWKEFDEGAELFTSPGLHNSAAKLYQHKIIRVVGQMPLRSNIQCVGSQAQAYDCFF